MSLLINPYSLIANTVSYHKAMRELAAAERAPGAPVFRAAAPTPIPAPAPILPPPMPTLRMASVGDRASRSFSVGRGEEATVNVGSGYAGVSRLHANVTELPDGRFTLTDLGSSNGTEILADGRWQRISTAQISPDQPIRLGREFNTSAAALSELLDRSRR